MLRALRNSLAYPRGTSSQDRPLFAKVRQVCTVVEDFEATLTHLVDDLGIGPFRCWHFRPPRLFDTTYRGRPAPFSMKLGMTWLDDVQWEVIQPMEGETLYRDHWVEKGRGVQHILMSTGTVSFEAASAELARKHHAFGQTAKLNARVQLGQITLPSLPNRLAEPICLEFGYIDAEKTLRTSIELTKYPLGFSERFALRSGKAEFCIPSGNAHFETRLPTCEVLRLVKVSIVTRDVEATVASYLDLARVGPWHLFEVNRERLGHARIGGETADFRARVAWGLIDDVLFELVEPKGGQSPYQDVLETRGEGVASLGVLPIRGVEELTKRCKLVGYPVAMTGSLVDASVPCTYMRSRKWIGTDLEILGPGQTAAAQFHRIKPDRVVHRGSPPP